MGLMALEMRVSLGARTSPRKDWTMVLEALQGWIALKWVWNRRENLGYTRCGCHYLDNTPMLLACEESLFWL